MSTEFFKSLNRISTEHSFELFTGKKVGLDGNWLVKSLIRQHGLDYFQHADLGALVDAFVSRIRALKQYASEVLVVFSGAPLPCQKLRAPGSEKQR